MTIDYSKDYYQILELTKDATAEDIKKAYRRLSKKYHPDKYKGEKEEANRIFEDLADGYEILRDEETRKDYDLNYINPSFALFRAIVTQNISFAEIEKYFDNGADVEAHNAFNQTILMFAANKANIALIEFLLKKGAVVNATDGAGNTPLMYAAITDAISFSFDNFELIKRKNKKISQEDVFECNQTDKTAQQRAHTSPQAVRSNEYFSWKLPFQIVSAVFNYFYRESLYKVVSTIYNDLLTFSQNAYSFFKYYFYKKLNSKSENYAKTSEMDRQKAAAAEILLANNAYLAQKNKYGKSSLDYAIDNHNVPLMNYFYKLLGMEDKIIIEENEIIKLDMSRAMVTSASIFEISKIQEQAMPLTQGKEIVETEENNDQNLMSAINISDLSVPYQKFSSIAPARVTGSLIDAQISDLSRLYQKRSSVPDFSILDQKISSVAPARVTASLVDSKIYDLSIWDQKISSVSASKITGSINIAASSLSEAIKRIDLAIGSVMPSAKTITEAIVEVGLGECGLIESRIANFCNQDLILRADSRTPYLSHANPSIDDLLNTLRNDLHNLEYHNLLEFIESCRGYVDVEKYGNLVDFCKDSLS